MKFKKQFGNKNLAQVICDEGGRAKPYQKAFNGNRTFEQVINKGDKILTWKESQEGKRELSIYKGKKPELLLTAITPEQIVEKVIEHDKRLFGAAKVLQKMVMDPNNEEFFIDRTQGDNGFDPIVAKPRAGSYTFLSPKIFKPVKKRWNIKHIGRIFTKDKKWIPNGNPIPQMIIDGLNNRHPIASDNPGLAQVYQVGQGYVVVIEEFPDKKVKKGKRPEGISEQNPKEKVVN